MTAIKVLYIGVYRDGGGWSQAARDYILALDTAGIDVVPRPLKLNQTDDVPPARILELERQSSQGCDIVIQHVLPHQMQYHGGITNIGLFASETSRLHSDWVDHLNLMDHVIAINHQQEKSCYESGVKKDISVVGHATDITRFEKRYHFLENIGERSDFLFYCIGECVHRKNFVALLKAYHLEFSIDEPVRLVFKTNNAKAIYEHNRRTKEGLKIIGAADPIVIDQRMSDEDIMRLHATCDCFVMPSYAETWCIPAMDAMGMGKTPIVPRSSGFLDYMNDDSGKLVPVTEQPCFGALDTFPNLYTGRENWWAIDVNELRKAMREAYERKDSDREEMAANGLSRAKQYSYGAIGTRFRETLEHVYATRNDRLAR